MTVPSHRRRYHNRHPVANPALNCHDRLWPALDRADLAMRNPAPRPFRTVRAHFDLRGTHPSCRATWMLLDGPPSWRQRGRPQPVNQAPNLSEQGSGDSDIRELKGDITALSHDLRADLDELLSQRSAANTLLPPIRLTSPLGPGCVKTNLWRPKRNIES